MDSYKYTTTIAGLYNAEIRYFGGDSGTDHQYFSRDLFGRNGTTVTSTDTLP
jgi:hypothetical protein